MNSTELDPTELAKYSAAEVASLADLDWHTVRNEGYRRSDIAEKKIARLQRRLIQARAEMADAEIIVIAAHAASDASA